MEFGDKLGEVYLAVSKSIPTRIATTRGHREERLPFLAFFLLGIEEFKFYNSLLVVWHIGFLFTKNMKIVDNSKLLQQVIPLILTGVIFLVLIVVLYIYIAALNTFPTAEKVVLVARPVDIFVGVTIYLKTAIDFAIFMGRLMSTNPGWRNRIAIEIGTALGNALGTLVVIALWVVFKEVEILLAAMVFLASLVLFELAHGGLEHFASWEKGGLKRTVYRAISVFLNTVKKIIDPLLSRIMPNLGDKLKGKGGLSWGVLFGFAFSVPFILGLDDFAGYVPLFSVINVFGFSIGVFLAHTILNIALFISPARTIVAVKNEYVSFLGTIAFIGLAFYGFYEVFRIFSH